MSTVWYSERPGSLAVDGNRGTATSSCARTNKLTEQWLEVDLGTLERIGHLIIYGQTDYTYTYSKAFINIDV